MSCYTLSAVSGINEYAPDLCLFGVLGPGYLVIIIAYFNSVGQMIYLIFRSEIPDHVQVERLRR